MSLFDLRDALRQINVQDETLVYYRVRNLELQFGLRLVNSDQSTLAMFVDKSDQSTIQMYAGEIPEDGNLADEGIVGENVGVDGHHNDNLVDGHIVDDGDESESSDGLYRPEEDSNESVVSDNDSDFEFFLDGDDLSDRCDPIDDEDLDEDVE